MNDTPANAAALADAAARQSYGKLVALLAARSRDVAAAEDALADAFAAALSQWPRSGVPANPEAWLLAVARRRAIDTVRRRVTAASATAHLRMLEHEREAHAMEQQLPDRRLALMFACAHPALDRAVRAPLILQTVLGFDAAAIASAFLVSPAAMSQRLVRAKARIRDAGIPFRVPDLDEYPERLDAVLDAVYAAYTEGWSDPAGVDTRLRNLAAEAIWLGRLVVALLPSEPEARGLLALMLFAESRRAARRDRDGGYVPLTEQDTALWDAALIEEAERHLRRAAAAAKLGRFQLEAAVQSAHTARRATGRADWAAILRFYETLFRITGSPVVAVNRAMAVAEVDGAAAGLARLDALAPDARLGDYQPYWAARARLLEQAGDGRAAAIAYDRAIGLERDPGVRRFLQGRRAGLDLP